MKIVVLDGITLNPGDLSWDAFKAFGEITVYDRTSQDQVIERVGDASIVLTNKTFLYRDLLEKLPNVKYIGLLSTGKNAVDIDVAINRGIIITHVPAYSTPSVAQMTFSLLLELCQQVGLHSNQVFEGKWANSKDFCFWSTSLIELKDKTIGIIGFGSIGKQVAAIARAFGMKVLVYSRKKQKDYTQVTLDKLLKESDIVSLHCPLTPKTEEIINQKTLSLMKKTAFLINTSRGRLINEADLAYALQNELIAGAGLDVLSDEPPKKDNPMLSAKNCIITPHIAWATYEARERLMRIVFENIRAYLTNNPINIVNSKD